MAASAAVFLERELAPYPGRAAAVGRMVAACVFTMLAVIVFQIPNGFLAVFYALAISREGLNATWRNGFALILGNLAGLALALAGIVLFVDFPLLHFVFLLGAFYLAFFLARTLTDYNLAFGFGIILLAASSVNIIWARPNPLRPDVLITLGTSFGIMLGTVAAVLADWIFSAGAAGGGRPSRTLFVADAFSNTAYVKFALKGCVAATICYVVWTAVAWPGLGVCTVTCFIVAPLSTSGSSAQRIVTRLAGLLLGGVILGIGSQVYILPALDSIAGFTLLFAAVSTVAAWIATSGPSLSYCGRQIALAYYLTAFQTGGLSASLAASRDRLMGILLGLLTMWLVFD